MADMDPVINLWINYNVLTGSWRLLNYIFTLLTKIYFSC